MRPYLTLLKDSFHEAFVSRVLWILLGVSTLVLVGIAPLGIEEQRFTRLRANSIADWPSLLTQIREQARGGQPSPGKRIWELGGASFQGTVDQAFPAGKPIQLNRQIVDTATNSLNSMLADRDFYDAASWATVDFNPATKESLANLDNLDQPDLEHLNRELLKAAFPNAIGDMPDEQLQVTFAGMPVGVPMTISRQMVEPAINRILVGVMDFFVGVIGVFVAILVTAPIIPQTFEAGAIDLLLSKPVSRGLLFLTKFVGGCAFILLNATYFIVALWLIVGLRFDMWNNSLLACIPLFMFLFMIYYAVSAYAAVRWKNTTVCIVVSILFWAICFGVGQTKEVLEQIVVKPNRLVDVIPTPNALVGVRQSGQFVEWRSDEWQVVIEQQRRRGPFRQRHLVVGSLFDDETSSLLYIEKPLARGNFGFVTGSTRLVTTQWTDGNWVRNGTINLPAGASWLFKSPTREILCVGTTGVFRTNVKAAAEQKEGGVVKKFFDRLLPPTADPVIQPAGALELSEPFAASMNPTSGELAVFSGGKLQRLASNEAGQFSAVAEAEVTDKKTTAVVAIAGDRIALVVDSGEVRVFDSDTLDELHQLEPSGRAEPFMVTANDKGTHFATVYHNGELVLFDKDANELPAVGSNVSSVKFEDDQLLVADEVAQVTRYNLSDFSVADTITPEATIAQNVHRYWVMPVYTIFPKPGRLGEVVSYVLTNNETQSEKFVGQSDLRESRLTTDIWGTIWSSLAFVVVVLGWTCWKIGRMDI